MNAIGWRWQNLSRRFVFCRTWFLDHSAKGAGYDSQGQARREAERVAPGLLK